MAKLLLLAKSNLRHEKSQACVLVALILIAALVLNLWLMLSVDYHANFDRLRDKLNAEDVLIGLSVPKSDSEKRLEEILADTPGITDSELTEALILSCTLPYEDGEITGNMFVIPEDAAFAKTIGRIEIISEDPDVLHGMYFPVLYETDAVQLGSEAEVTINGEKRKIPVRGFLNSLMAGSHNCGITILVAEENLFKDLQPDGIPGTLISVRAADRDMSRNLEGGLVEAVSEAFPDATSAGTSYPLVRQSRYISQMITSGILGAAAFFVLLVAVVVVSSNTVNRIQQTMPELGVLKGIGYTGADLIRSFVWQYSILSLSAGIAGSALAYTVFPALVRLMDEQTGIPYSVHFLTGPFVASSVVCWIVVAAAAWLASRRIRKIEPITALRSGVETHSFKRNPVPLAESRGSVNLALAMKSCAMSGRRNFTLCAMMAVLTLLITAASVLVQNVIVDVNPMLDLIGVEQADIFFEVSADSEDELRALLSEDDRVDRFYLYHQQEDMPEPGGSGLSAIVMDDAKELNNQGTLFEGRYPEYEDEIAIGAKHANARELGIGDSIELGSGENRQSYLITGLTQGSNYLGDECILTRDGFLRLGDSLRWSYYVDLKEGEDIPEVISDIQDDLSGSIYAAVNIRSILAGSLAAYVGALQAIVWILAALTLILAALVVGLQTRTMLTAKMHDFGVLKALGYTTRDLVLQTVGSFLPPLVLSEAAGLILWSLTMNPLFSLFLKNIGTMRCSFAIPADLILICGAVLLGYALLTVFVMCIRIRKVSPAALVRAE